MLPWKNAASPRAILRVGALSAALWVLAWLGWQGTSAPPAFLPSLPILHATPDSLVEPVPAGSRHDHLAKLGVDRWHKDGHRGQGIKVAILDNGFRGYHDFLGKGLPEHVTGHSFRKDHNLEARDSQHGILCAEVVHALAPAAQLLLANWEPDDPASFLEAIRWAKAEGARILTCSVIMPNWSDGEGGGQVHAALARLLGAGQSSHDLLCFASAGNIAQRHWTGPFRPDAGGLHQWAPGQTLNALKPWGPERISVQLYGQTQGTCALQVFDKTTGDLIGQAPLHAEIGSGWGQATIRFDPAPRHDYLVRLQCRHGNKPAATADQFHLVALGGSLEHSVPGGSIPFPGDGANVLAVGAVDLAGKRLSYSSCGPNSRQPKPDFVAPVPFPSMCRERPFTGTSSAAPQAAALAALCWGQHPTWSPHQIRAALRSAALDLCAPGHDCETGYGLIRLP